MSRDPIDLRARERDKIEEESKKRARRAAELEDVKWLLQSPQGRRFIWRLLEKAGIYRSTFTGSAPHDAFAEGIRSVGLMVIADVFAADPDAYTKMLKEQPK